MRIEKKLIWAVVLLAVLLIALPQLRAEGTAALEVNNDDFFWLDDVCSCTGDSPGDGHFQGTVYWDYPDPASPPPYGVGYVSFYLAFTGSMQCDSVRVAYPIADTLSIDGLLIDNENGELDISLAFISEAGPIFTSGKRQVLNLYFTMSDTGDAAIYQWHDVYIRPWGLMYGWPGYFQTSDFRLRLPGDFDGNGLVGNISDAVFLIQYIFGGEDQRQDIPLADTNGDCLINITDVVYLINYIFGGGPAPGCEF
jgi:hypothetical protein